MAKTKTPPGKKPPIKSEDETDDTQDTEDTEDTEDGEDDAAEENRRINAIVTNRVKREMKSVNNTLSQISAQLAEMNKSKTQEPTDDDEESTEKKAPELDPKLAKKMTKLERELADEKAARVKAETERGQEQEKARRNEMRSAFASQLTELGLVSPRLQRAALDQLEQDGVMIRDENDKIKFKGQDKYGIETNFDPKVGLKAWIAGEGKEFVPAVDAGGSGTGGTRGTGNGSQHLTSTDIKKMSPQQLASINLERACSGMPPIGQE